LGAIGLGTALAAISDFFPVAQATQLAQAKPDAIEKKQLKIGFIPITCATPIIVAEPLGFYRNHGLEAEVIKTTGWAVIRDKALNKEYDAAHMLSPMPLAITLGAGAAAQPWTMAAIENINGRRSPWR
jgi:nitrate/nitrite transport system substrate-binding protein